MRRLAVFWVSIVLSAPLAAKTFSRTVSAPGPTTLVYSAQGVSLGESKLPALSAPVFGESVLVLPEAIVVPPVAVVQSVQRAGPILAVKPIREVKNAAAKSKKPERGIKAGLIRFSEAIGKKTAPIRGLIFKLFDGTGAAFGNAADEYSAEEAYAPVERQVRREEAVRHAEQPLPVYDYMPGRFSAESAAEEFVDVVFDFSGTEKSGREILEFLVTPYAVHPSIEPDPEQMDVPLFGRSDAEIRSFAQDQGIAGWRFDDTMRRAFRAGLIYRIHDRKRGKTFTGVPYAVREAFDLKEPSVEKVIETEEAPAPVLESMQSLGALAGRMKGLAATNEIFEFAAQAADIAAREGRLDWDSLPDEFRTKAAAYRGERGALADALITLAESAHGTEWFDAAVSVAEEAASDGIIDAAELRGVISNLD